MDDPTEATLNLIYRHAYGIASDGMARFSMGPAGIASETLLARLMAEVRRDMGDVSEAALDAIRRGVADAVEGRRPAW